MTEFRNRIVTDYWTVVLPDGWLQSRREGKPGIEYISADSKQRMIINTLLPEERAAEDPGAVLSAFEDAIRDANTKMLAQSYTIIFTQRSSEGPYLATTIAGFDAPNRMGICTRKYV